MWFLIILLILAIILVIASVAMHHSRNEYSDVYISFNEFEQCMTQTPKFIKIAEWDDIYYYDQRNNRCHIGFRSPLDTIRYSVWYLIFTKLNNVTLKQKALDSFAEAWEKEKHNIQKE